MLRQTQKRLLQKYSIYQQIVCMTRTLSVSPHIQQGCRKPGTARMFGTWNNTHHSGAWFVSAWDLMTANMGRSCASQPFLLHRTRAAAPSETGELFPAVTVPFSGCKHTVICYMNLVAFAYCLSGRACLKKEHFKLRRHCTCMYRSKFPGQKRKFWMVWCLFCQGYKVIVTACRCMK
jgi:hypothetical protein